MEQNYSPEMKQKAYSFDLTTLKKIVKGAWIAVGGAAMVALLQYISGLDFGNNSAIVGAVCAILINVVREYIKGNEQ